MRTYKAYFKTQISIENKIKIVLKYMNLERGEDVNMKNFNEEDTDLLSERTERWNLFVEDICYRDMSTLNRIQRNAVLCFWYDAEMNSGGHSGYFDCHPETNPEELYRAIIEISNQEIANNYKKAITDGELDDYLETDDAYYKFEPSLCDFLEEYVEQYKDKIFE